MRSFFAGSAVVLSLEGHRLRFLVVKAGRVHSWSSARLAEEGSDEASATLQGVLRSLLFGRDGIKKQVAFSFPGDRAIFRTVVLPRLKPRLASEALRREAQRQLPVEAGQAYVLWQIVRRTLDQDYYLLLAIQRQSFDKVHAALKDAGVSPRIWELKPLALVRAVNRSDVAILDLDQESAELVLVVRGTPRLVRTLSDQPGIGREERARRLADEVSKTIDFYGSGKPEDPWAAGSPLVVTGPLADDVEWMNALKSASTLPMEPFASPLPCPPDFPAATYATATGVAMKRGHPRSLGDGRQSLDFNALPREYRTLRVQPRAVAIGAALAAGALLLVPTISIKSHRDAALADQRSDLDRLRRQVTLSKNTLAKRVEEQRQVNDILALVAALRQERDSILADGEPASRSLNSALTALTTGVVINKVTSKGEAVTLEGEAPTFAAVLDYARALEQSPPYSSVSVTTLAQKPSENNPPSAVFVLTASRQRSTGV